MTFQEILKQELDKRNWQPVRLAAELSERGSPVSPFTVDRWVDGGSKPRIEYARAVADVFGMTLDELYPSLEVKS